MFVCECGWCETARSRACSSQEKVHVHIRLTGNGEKASGNEMSRVSGGGKWVMKGMPWVGTVYMKLTAVNNGENR